MALPRTLAPWASKPAAWALLGDLEAAGRGGICARSQCMGARSTFRTWSTETVGGGRWKDTRGEAQEALPCCWCPPFLPQGSQQTASLTVAASLRLRAAATPTPCLFHWSWEPRSLIPGGHGCFPVCHSLVLEVNHLSLVRQASP